MRTVKIFKVSNLTVLVLSNIQNEESILLEVLINFLLLIMLVHKKHHSLGNCADFHAISKDVIITEILID